jgi:hypothetical protein
MEGPGKAMEVKKEGEVHTQILSLREAVHGMEECIKQIGIRLGCVCRAPEPASEKGQDRKAVESEVADNICVEVSKLTEARSILNGIMSRLEI